MKTLWVAGVAILIAGCAGQASTPAATTDPLDAKVSNTKEFKTKYQPLTVVSCIKPSCYITRYKPVFDRLSQDASALSGDDEINLRTRIQTFDEDVDTLTRKGCTEGQDMNVACQLTATGPEAAVTYIRNYVNS